MKKWWGSTLAILAIIAGYVCYCLVRPLQIGAAKIQLPELTSSELSATSLGLRRAAIGYINPEDNAIQCRALGDGEAYTTPIATASLAKMITVQVVLDKYPLKAGESGPTITMTNDDENRYWWAVNNGGSNARVVAGEQITERGIGNGISLIIFAGIVAGLPAALAQTFEQARQGDLSTIALLIIGVVVVVVTFFVVFIERGQRRIPIDYAKRQMGNRIYSQPRSSLPLKINMSGVIPAIFASSIILFPGTIVSWFGQGENSVANVLQEISLFLQPGQPLYELLYAAAIIFFTFFYTALVFNPRDVAENLKKSGAFIPGIRPGEQTARFIDKVMTRLTLSGALYMVLVCLVPQLLMNWFNVQFYFGGTSLLIIVVVIMDFVAQLQSHRMNQQYGDLMRKANLRNYGR